MEKHHVLIIVLAIALLLAGTAVALAGSATSRYLAPAAADPNQISFTLEGCKLGTYDEATFTCLDGDYTTGNLGKLWSELDLVPHRLSLKNNDGDQTYAFAVAADHKKDGVTGYDFISGLTLNDALSDASCTAAVNGSLLIASGIVGGVDETMYRLVTVTQKAGTTCVYDYYQRLAIGASKYPGSSLQSGLLYQDLSSIGQRSVPINPKEILPQQLRKDMSAVQDAEHIWNLTKAPQPNHLPFVNTCDPEGRAAGVSITVAWTKLPATPTGDITVVTNIYAKNPAARIITVNVTDEIRTGTTVLDTKSSGPIDVPANTEMLVLTHMATIPDGTTDLNDVATATYTDKVTGVPVPGQTTATASADVQPSGVTKDQTATINDVESITGTYLQYSADSFVGASGAFDGGYVAGTPTTSPVSWTSAMQSDSGSVTFNKTVYVTQPAITSGTLADTATLNGSDGFSTDADASVDISANALVELTINKTIPDILQGSDTASFTFDVTGPASYADSVTLDFAAGDTSKSTTLSGLTPGQYTVKETAPAGWAPQPEKMVNISLPTCAESVSFSNSIVPAKAKVKKVTIPPGFEADWEFTLNGPGGPEKVTTTGTGYVAFATHLQEGSYTITETLKPGWESDGGSAECSFTVDYPAAAGREFVCTFTNEGLATKAGLKFEDVNGNGKRDEGEPGLAGWIIELWDATGKIAEAQTDADGNYKFDDLMPGAYVVCEQLKPGWAQSFPKQGEPGTLDCPPNLSLGPIGYSFELGPGEDETGNDFGNYELGTIIVEKQTDPDKDPTPFEFIGDAAGSIKDGEQIKKSGLMPGTYTSTEILPEARCTGQPLPEIIFRGTRASLKKGQLYVVKGTDRAITEAFTDIVWQDRFGDSNHLAAAVRPHTDMIWDYDAWEVLEGWREPFLMFSPLKEPIDVVSLGTYESGVLISAVALDHLNHVFQGNTRHAQVYLLNDGTETLLGQLEIAEPARITVAVPEPGGEVQIRTHDSTVWWTTCESLDWELIDITCDDENSSGNLDTQMATFRVESGETVTCTFTDQKESAALVGKETDPDGDPTRFDFTGDLAGNIGDGSQLVKTGLFKGTYASTEKVPSGWELKAITCDDPTGDSSGDAGTATATLKVAAGEIVECTFADEKDGAIVVENQTIPNGDPTRFRFQGDLSGRLADGGRISKTGLKAGTYVVSESVPDGWDLMSIWCDDANSAGLLDEQRASFRVEAGETVRCVFYNWNEEAARPDPSIGVSYTADPAAIYEPGGVVDFGVRVVNRGEMAVTLTSLQDDFYGDLAAATADPDETSSDACRLPQPISADGIYECVYRGHVVGEPGHSETHSLRATASDDAQRQTQGQDTATVVVGDASSALEVSLVAVPSIVAEPGGDVRITATVLNSSTTDDVAVSSVIADKVGDVSSSCTPALPATLSPAGSLTCPFSLRITGAAGEIYAAEVLASGTDDDGGYVDDVGSAEVRIVSELPEHYVYLPIVAR